MQLPVVASKVVRRSGGKIAFSTVFLRNQGRRLRNRVNIQFKHIKKNSPTGKAYSRGLGKVNGCESKIERRKQKKKEDGEEREERGKREGKREGEREREGERLKQ